MEPVAAYAVIRDDDGKIIINMIGFNQPDLENDAAILNQTGDERYRVIPVEIRLIDNGTVN